MDLRKRKNVSYADDDPEEDEVLSKRLKNNVSNESSELVAYNRVPKVPTSSISIYKDEVSGYLDEIKNRDSTFPVGGESHYQFVHDCLSISKSEVSTVLGVLLDDFWWPCEFVSKSNSDTDTHKVLFDTSEGSLKAGIDPSNLPEQINDEPIDKDSYLVRDLPCYQIASIDTKELLEHTNNCLFYKGSRIAAQKQGSGVFSGIVAETSCAYNNNRILVFFDDGSISYVHSEACHMTFGYQNNRSRKVEDTSAYKIPNIYLDQRKMIYKFLDTNLRILLKLKTQNSVKIKINQKVYTGTVKSVDCSIATILYSNTKDSSTKELCLYRGSQQFVDVEKYLKTIHHEIPCQPDEKFDYHWADVEKRWSDIDYDYSSKLTTSNGSSEPGVNESENAEETDDQKSSPDSDQSGEDSDDMTLVQIKTANKKIKRKRKLKKISQHSDDDECSLSSLIPKKKKSNEKDKNFRKNKKHSSNPELNSSNGTLPKQKKNIKKDENPKKTKKQVSKTVNSVQNGKKSTPELTSMQMKIILNEVQQNKKGKKIPKLKKYSPKSNFPKSPTKTVPKKKKKEKSAKIDKPNQKSQKKVTKNKTMHRRKLNGLPDTLKSYHKFKKVIPENQKKRKGKTIHMDTKKQKPYNVKENQNNDLPPNKKRRKVNGHSKS